MNNECYLDICLKRPSKLMSMKINENENDLQMTIILGILNKIEIQDESILTLKYNNGEVRLEIEPEAFYEFVLTQLKTD